MTDDTPAGIVQPDADTPRDPLAAQPCEFVPAHEPWQCNVHHCIRTRLDEPQCDAIRPAPPLTAEQVEQLRTADAQGRVHTGRMVVRSLLATLDATRPSDHEHEWEPITGVGCFTCDSAQFVRATRPSGDEALDEEHCCGDPGHMSAAYRAALAIPSSTPEAGDEQDAYEARFDTTRPSGDEWTVDAVFDALGRGDITEPAARDGIKTLLSVARPSGDDFPDPALDRVNDEDCYPSGDEALLAALIEAAEEVIRIEGQRSVPADAVTVAVARMASALDPFDDATRPSGDEALRALGRIRDAANGDLDNATCSLIFDLASATLATLTDRGGLTTSPTPSSTPDVEGLARRVVETEDQFVQTYSSADGKAADEAMAALRAALRDSRP